MLNSGLGFRVEFMQTPRRYMVASSLQAASWASTKLATPKPDRFEDNFDWPQSFFCIAVRIYKIIKVPLASPSIVSLGPRNLQKGSVTLGNAFTVTCTEAASTKTSFNELQDGAYGEISMLESSKTGSLNLNSSALKSSMKT